MTRYFYKCLVFLAVVHSSVFADAAPGPDAAPLHRAHQALTNIIIHDIFSPPVSSRIYMYAHVAAYETLVKASTAYRSLHGQVSTFPAIPEAPQEVSYGLASLHAFLLTAKGLIFSEQMLEDSIQKIIRPMAMVCSPQIAEASRAYGKQVSDIILAWSKTDGYSHTRKLRRYSFKKEDGTWKPTPPMYMAAVEPHWRLMRTLALDSAAQYKPLAPPQFSAKEDSEFYKLAYEVYQTVKNLTPEQRQIASFWDCNPFAVNVHGHINYATKKLSPGGHWLSIAGIASRQIQADITKTSAAYTLTAIALYDGFISCWDEKYRSNLVRPESYINAYIDETWKPLLQTPPFPEYTSGHSVISTASAIVLTKLFGNNFAFTDISEVDYGLGTRTFSSFNEACDEAAMSRLYGGIHYLPAIRQGQIQGKKVGEQVLAKISLLK